MILRFFYKLKLGHLFILSGIGFVAILVIILAFVVNINLQRQKISIVQQEYLEKIQLINELGFTANTLSEMTALYLITNDKNYRDFYWEAIEIMEGNKVKPAQYNSAYWDFIISNKKRPGLSSNKRSSISESILNANFKSDELKMLHNSLEALYIQINYEMNFMNVRADGQTEKQITDMGGGGTTTNRQPLPETNSLLFQQDTLNLTTNDSFTQPKLDSLSQYADSLIQAVKSKQEFKYNIYTPETTDSVLQKFYSNTYLQFRLQTKQPLDNLYNILINRYKEQNSKHLYFYQILSTGVLWTVILGIIVTVWLQFFLRKLLINPIVYLNQDIDLLSRGELPNVARKYKGSNEIANMWQSFNSYLERIINLVQFASDISNNKENKQFKLLSKKDVLGLALLDIKASIEAARKADAERQKEEKIRNWKTEGLARFGDILRSYSGDREDYYFRILSELTNYIEAIQGGLFVVENEKDEEPKAHLVASYAYNKRRIRKKTIPAGEGLIGACLIEKSTILINKIPKNYIELGSGLGESPPTHLLIIPVKQNKKILGVMEFASFNNFGKDTIDFVEQLAESFGTTLASTRANEQTEKLLQQSRRQSEELASQEEEMRQNLEELQATQEEIARKETKNKNFIEALNGTILRAEFDLGGRLIYANPNFLRGTDFSYSEVDGKNLYLFIPRDQERIIQDKYLQLIKNGKPFAYTGRYRSKNSYVWLKGQFTPIKDSDNEILKVLFVAMNITDIIGQNS